MSPELETTADGARDRPADVPRSSTIGEGGAVGISKAIAALAVDLGRARRCVVCGGQLTEVETAAGVSTCGSVCERAKRSGRSRDKQLWEDEVAHKPGRKRK